MRAPRPQDYMPLPENTPLADDPPAVDPAAALAAAKKKARANSSGVFSLDDLHALGQTGDMKTDWMNGANAGPTGLIGGGGRAVIPTGIPGGYYQIPGFPGTAQVYDPKNGQVSSEFVDWVNRATPADIAQARLSSQDTGDIFRGSENLGQARPTVDTLDKIFALGKDSGGTYQDSQDRVLGIGGYQQFLTDKNGKQMRIQDVPGYGTAASPSTFTDLGKPQAGAFDRLSIATGLTGTALDKKIGLTGPGVGVGGRTADYWLKMENSLASNYETNVQKGAGLQEVRKLAGQDPLTGISASQTKSISDTYSRIQDPAEKAAYIKAQDPGNLTPELRAARQAAGGGTADATYRSLVNAEKPNVQYENAALYGAPKSGEGKYQQGAVTYGSQVSTDLATGRETVVGNVPTKFELVKPNMGSFDEAMKRAGGAIGGGFLGFLGGGVPGAFLGAYQGAGGPLPNAKNISFKNAKGWGEWNAGAPRTGISLTEVGTALAFARFTNYGMYGKSSMSPAAKASRAPGGLNQQFGLMGKMA